MTVREYIGARYVPLFMGEWDNTRTYEPLSIVQYQGNSYTSRQFVPTGIAITNTDYWANTGNYNAQVEAYRQEVLAFEDRIDNLEDALPITAFDGENTVDARFDAIEANNWVTNDRISDGAVTSDKILDGTIATADLADGAVTSEKITDGTIATADIADGAVTSAKIASEAVTREKIASEAVSTSKVANKSITREKLVDGLAEIKNGICVFVGDSITYGYGLANRLTERWSNVICSANNWEEHNYAVGGAGFIAGGEPTFETQLGTAASDSTFDNNDVKYVFIAGGINDGNNTPGALVTKVVSTINTAKSDFPNAQVVVVLGLCAATPPNSITAGQGILPRLQRLFSIYQGANTTNGALIIGDAWKWLQGYSAYAIDTVHPSATGHIVIASHVNSILRGYSEPLSVYTEVTVPVSANVSAVALKLFNVDCATHLRGYFQVTGSKSIAAQETLFTIPEQARMSEDVVLLATDGFGNIWPLLFDADGNGNVKSWKAKTINVDNPTDKTTFYISEMFMCGC